MKDTGFYVPADKLDRVAAIYQGDATAGAAPMPRDPDIVETARTAFRRRRACTPRHGIICASRKWS